MSKFDLSSVKSFYLRLAESINKLASSYGDKVSPECWKVIHHDFSDVADTIRKNGDNNPNDLIHIMEHYYSFYDKRKDTFSISEFIDKYSHHYLDEIIRKEAIRMKSADVLRELSLLDYSHPFEIEFASLVRAGTICFDNENCLHILLPLNSLSDKEVELYIELERKLQHAYNQYATNRDYIFHDLEVQKKIDELLEQFNSSTDELARSNLKFQISQLKSELKIPSVRWN